MFKRAIVAAAITALVGLSRIPPAAAQAAADPRTTPFSLSASRQSSTALRLGRNDSTCSVVVYTATGFTRAPQATSDIQTNPGSPTCLECSPQGLTSVPCGAHSESGRNIGTYSAPFER
jgi:hypothetical protein